jgi:uncharacterized membrane protein YtjA (UPF0391 family)
MHHDLRKNTSVAVSLTLVQMQLDLLARDKAGQRGLHLCARIGFAAALGFGALAGTAAGIAKILFLVFLVLFVVSLIFGRVRPVA